MRAKALALVTLLAGAAYATTITEQSIPADWLIALERTDAQLRIEACSTYPSRVCLRYGTQSNDLFTSTGSAVGQWRNTRTGEGP